MNDNSDADRDSLTAFVEQVLATGQLWGLASADGWAVCASSDDESVDVYPFWSERASAASQCVDEWSVFQPAAIDLADFLEDWLPGMDADEVLAGTDWNRDLEGPELEPAYLAELLTRHQQPH